MPNDTTKAAPDERAELKPCPFCGDPMVPANECMGFTHNLRRKASRDCVISWAVIRPAHYAEWNTRTPPQVKPLVWSDAQVMGCEGKVSGPYQICMSSWKYNGGLPYISRDPISSANADNTRRILDALA